MRDVRRSWEPSLGRMLGGALFAMICLTAIGTLVLGGIMWVFTSGFLRVLG
jgi:hypothetical protein